MKKVVFDTNIIISAALSPDGNPAKVIESTLDDAETKVFYNEEILAEYNMSPADFINKMGNT